LVLARPFIEHACLSMVMTVAGADTGATLYGPADMQISANTTVKTIEGHFTCHTKAVITKPKNVLVLRDVQADAYIAGSCTTWFGDVARKEDTNANGLTSTHVKTDLTARLDEDREYDNRYASMLAFACPYEEELQCMEDQAFSISSMALPWEIRQGSQSNFPGGEKFFQCYHNLFGLGHVMSGSDPASIQTNDFVRNGTYHNSICLLGPHRHFSAFTQSYFDLTPGQGHFGPDALPGDARWRRGEAIDAESARGALVGVEAIMESKKAMHRM